MDGIAEIPLSGKNRETAGPTSTASAGYFLAGPENRLVEVAVRGVLAEPLDGQPRQPATFNPLVLYGPSGTGKSHLARGLAAAWKSRGRNTSVVCTTAVDFARELAEAIETQAVEEFRTKHRGADLLVIEDLGLLTTRKSDRLSAQEELIHTLDILVAEDRWIVVTASAAPTELPGILPPLQSRLTGGLLVPVAPPGPEARLAILERLAQLHDLDVPDAVIQVLAEGICGTAPELAGSLLELEMPAALQHRRIDLPAARQYLAKRGRGRQPTLHEIALTTARHFTIRLADLKSSARRRALVTARGVAVYLARRLTDESLQKIGSYFGGRDHTTVLHSCRRIEELMAGDPTIRQSIELLQKTLWKT